jgi:hypothetical protein
MVKDVFLFAPDLLKGVGQDREAVEGAVGVDAFGKGDDRGS